MKAIAKAELVPFPTETPQANCEFDCVAENGVFKFHFKWLNNRWNLWVTMPDGSVRQAGVVPGVTSWSGFDDYGLLFETSLEEINFDSLFTTEMFILTWQ